MTSLWFVTPAWQRFELAAACFDQRRLVMDELAAAGIEARCVVVADDDNLDLARERGFDVVERDNDWLGRRFNDGQEYAGRHGADWIVPIGSDSFVDPAYFLPLPAVPARTGRAAIRTSAMYAPILPDRLATLKVGKYGAGPHVFHRSLLAPRGFRPAPDAIARNTDHNTILGIGRQIGWDWRDIHPLQYVGFRVAPFITDYDRLWRRWGVAEDPDPWASLARHYPPELVERVRRLMVRELEGPER